LDEFINGPGASLPGPFLFVHFFKERFMNHVQLNPMHQNIALRGKSAVRSRCANPVVGVTATRPPSP